MDFAIAIPVVALLAMLSALVLALAGVIGARKPDPTSPKSTLARDGGLGGVGYLIPEKEREAVIALRRSRGQATGRN